MQIIVIDLYVIAYNKVYQNPSLHSLKGGVNDTYADGLAVASETCDGVPPDCFITDQGRLEA